MLCSDSKIYHLSFKTDHYYSYSSIPNIKESKYSECKTSSIIYYLDFTPLLNVIGRLKRNFSLSLNSDDVGNETLRLNNSCYLTVK